MIKLQNLDELKQYFAVPDELIDFAKTLTEKTENRRYEFSDGCFVNVMHVDTKAELGDMEAHERYVDVQCVLAGEEKFLYANRASLTVTVPYDAEKDIGFYAFEFAEEVVCLAGEGIVLYPNEAHLPGRAVTEPMTIKKAVIKIPYCQAIR